MLREKIRTTKIELIPYYTYFFFMTQNRTLNIINIKNYKNRFVRKFFSGCGRPITITFFSSYCIPFLLGFEDIKAAPSNTVY